MAMFGVVDRGNRLRELAALGAAAVGVALLLGACAGRTPVRAPKVQKEPLPPPPVEYRLQVNDLLDVKFWGNEDLDEQVRVRPDGMISLPFIDDVPAAGLTPEELDAELVRRYASELARPNITVVLNEPGSQIYVGGEVNTQGTLPLDRRLTLVQAIQASGGFRTSARRRQVLLIRTQPDGDRIARAVDVRPVLSGKNLTIDPVLQPFDVVFVPRTKISNINLFVQQYVNQIIPFQGIATAAVTQGNLFSNNDNTGN